MARDRIWNRFGAANKSPPSINSKVLRGSSSSSASVGTVSSASAPSLTLKIGAVTFELVPETMASGSSVQYVQGGHASSHVLCLKNFTGSLRVIQQSTDIATVEKGQQSTPRHKFSVTGTSPMSSVSSEEYSRKKRSLDADDQDEDKITEQCRLFEDIKRARHYASDTEVPLAVEIEKTGADENSKKKASKEQDARVFYSEQHLLLGQLSQASQATLSDEEIAGENEDEDIIQESSTGGEDGEHVIRNLEISTTSDKIGRTTTDGIEGNCEDYALDCDDDDCKKDKVEYETLNSLPVSIGGVSPSPEKEQLAKSDEKPQASSSKSHGPAESFCDGGVALLNRSVIDSSDSLAPRPRWGHTFTRVGDDRFIVYGGQTIQTEPEGIAAATTLNDLHIYQVDQGKWIRPANWKSALPRQWHTSTYLPDQQLLLVFGGEASGKKIKPDSQMMLLDTDIMVWYPPTVSGQPPSSRSGHSATLLRPPAPGTYLPCQYLVVFGGVGNGGKRLNTFFVLDTNRWIWFQPPKIHGMAPQPRTYHTATAVGNNCMVVFGGNNDTHSFDTVHLLTVTTHDKPQVAAASETNTLANEPKKRGRKPIKKSGKNSSAPALPKQYQYHQWTWTHPSTIGPKPHPRTGHSATLLEDGKTLCIYGGWDPNEDDENKEDEETTVFDDCFLLDTSTWEWSRGPKLVVSCDNSENTPRVGHKAICHQGDNNILIFGGRTAGDQFMGDLAWIPLNGTKS